MRFAGVFIALAVLLAGVQVALGQTPASSTVTLTFVGDIMLGRSVGTIVEADPDGVFREVRQVLRESDLAFGNLESPLTALPHTSPNPNDLTAVPSVAELLATAGFDAVSVANNHAGDAGSEGVVDTLQALERAGVRGVGAGRNAAEAARPLFFDANGLDVAVLAFDASGAGLAAGTAAGVARWEPEAARKAVEAVRRGADLVVVSVHGGVEYLPESDPRILAIAHLLVDWGADVVWGHGPHVPQPVVPAGNNERTAVVTTSLGNFLFDQRGPLTGGGLVLQVLADRDGVIAHRVATTSHHDLRTHFTGWQLPDGDAVYVNGSWWSLQRLPSTVERPHAAVPDPFPWGEILAADVGALTGETPELVVSYRAPAGSHPVRDGVPEARWNDTDGNTMHLGVFTADGLAPVWQAGVVPAPIGAVAVCDGSLALAYRSLDSPTIHSTGAATWRPAGFTVAEALPGPGEPACGDVDRDGRTEPLLLAREADVRP